MPTGDRDKDRKAAADTALRDPTVWVLLIGGLCGAAAYLYAIDTGSQQARSISHLTAGITSLLIGTLVLLLPQRTTYSRRGGLFWLCLGLVLIAPFVA